MDGTRRFLEVVLAQNLMVGNLRGVFHIAIGRKLTAPDGTVISVGVTWRELSILCKSLKLDTELVQELGADPDTLSPKDREKFWYFAVAHAKVNSAEARDQADTLVAPLKKLGIIVGPAPGVAPPTGKVSPVKSTPPQPAKEDEKSKTKSKPAKKKP